MKKRALAIVLSVFMAACMTACGDSASTADTEKTEGSSSQAQSESTADSESKTESGADSESKADSSASDSSSSSDSSKTEEKQETKHKMLSKIETFDENNTLIYLQEYVYTTDTASGNIECVLTQTGKRIAGNPVTAQSQKNISRYVYNKDLQVVAVYGGSPQKLESEYSYDENGKLVKRIDYDNKGELNLTVVYERSGDGEVVKETQYNRKNEVHRLIEYENGNKKKETYKTTGYVTQYTYDGSGNLIKQDIYGKNGSLEETISIEYDNKGHRTHYKDYYVEQNMVRIEYAYENSYTDSGYTQTEYTLLDGKRELTGKIIYGEKEFENEELVYLNGKVVETTKYTYIEM
ncbi:MAG: hypothetical protein K6F27_07310 [Ruminococcus sp.]|nr:hypothetical protein [Ruminococcus sp.]